MTTEQIKRHFANNGYTLTRGRYNAVLVEPRNGIAKEFKSYAEAHRHYFNYPQAKKREDNWKAGKRDITLLINAQRRIDAIRERYTDKYGENDNGEPNSQVAVCLDCAAASLEEIFEHQN